MQNTMDFLEQRAYFIGCSPQTGQGRKVILGLPMDATTSFRPGTRLASYRIREVSEGIEEYSIYQDRSLENCDFSDLGDVSIPFGNVSESLARMEAVAEELLAQGRMIYSLGGEHLVSLPIIKAYKRRYPDLVVVQMDAHADLREDYLGEPLSHASVMRRAVDVVGPGNLFQLGIRSGTQEELAYARENTFLYLDQVLPCCPEVIERIGQRPVYLTLDIDVLDPAYAPGTGTPEAGGISSRELFQVLHDFRQLNIVGFDLVEISPPLDNNDITSILGAKILREVLLAY
ncbi:MAG TPA: agmatinase [Syntrophomonadaceae bacterium]|nr:agmatinase [Syntrophomonadaceae bacterium]